MFASDEFTTAWTSELHKPAERLPPLVVHDSVYVGTVNDLIAFGAADGTKQREFGLHESIAAGPTFGDGLIHVGTHARDSATVYAVKPDGSSAWDLTTDASSIDAISTGNGLTYFAADRRVYGVRDGTKEWEFDNRTRNGRRNEINALAYADGTVVVAASGAVIGLNATDGTQRWQVGTEESCNLLTVSNDYAAVGSSEFLEFYVLEITSGEVQWQQRPSKPLSTQPVVTEDAVYVAQYHSQDDDGRLVAFDKSDGSELWSPRRAGSDLIVGLVAAEDTLYVAYVSGELHAHDTFDGEQRASEEFDGDYVQSMTGHDSRLYLTADSSSSGTGQLVAISTPHEGMGESHVADQSSEDEEPVADAATSRTTCPSCGEPLDGDEAFCPGCGHALSE